MLAEQVSLQIAKSGKLGLARRLFATHELSARGGSAHPGEAARAAGEASLMSANILSAPAGAELARRRPVLRTQADMIQPQRRAQSAAAAAALPIVERLIATVEAENRDLEQGRPAQYEAYSLRKNQGLLELNRLIPALDRASAAGPLREALADLHAKLEANRQALAVQLKACAAVSEIIARAIQDGQSDGTYTALAWTRSRE